MALVVDGAKSSCIGALMRSVAVRLVVGWFRSIGLDVVDMKLISALDSLLCVVASLVGVLVCFSDLFTSANCLDKFVMWCILLLVMLD